ncbi:CbtB-domain containing protein [Phaeobacter gallaeciensis]|uniref:CbtB domain-containing protein n=1 Tax=Phaeobacter gallaeciensis TaxID=60890 RepID=UPI00237F39C5|nr:CbtB domain-containing protein [Phaeobacter gallaeciensis]MDE4305821.1 CbtB-domain containing protein [Phaeobacter gallaeciensis]MDE4310198.1 CbtB-domain containing protein [Phaeobacter gallaeciensis]MDE4314710.1 CbtB-domain containing protein [Phaeobacter gallaeciensis]MDE4319101.1 CbtB-domain containing protein [Phaeobacter gallaeciensis]MDE4323571.1 CbtB-domain containing protein [Phaeobacter gallaeciensis]
MTTVTLKSSAISQSSLWAPALFLAIGIGIIFVAGHVQANTLHDVAHDVRHATGFPCH